MSFFFAQNGLRAGYIFENAIVVLDATDATSLMQNANGLSRWRDGSGEQNDVVAAAGGEPAVTTRAGRPVVYFAGNRSLELAVPFFPSPAQSYKDWTLAISLTPRNLAGIEPYTALFAPSTTAAGNPNFLFYEDRQWGIAAGGGGFPRLGAVTQDQRQVLILTSSASANKIWANITGTGERLVYQGPLDNGIHHFGLGYGIEADVEVFAFFNVALTADQRQALHDELLARP